MTNREFNREFLSRRAVQKELARGSSADKAMLREAWAREVDALQRSGDISVSQAERWSYPKELD